LNGIYNFHASASAYAEYWNNSVWKHQSVNFKGITRRQVWQAFVQESIHTIASTYGTDLTLQDGLAIDEVTKEAFEHLGQNGIILPAKGHHCSECTHPYKRTTDIRASNDPAATLGVEDYDAPALQNTNPSMRQSSSVGSERMDVDGPVAGDVTMAVVDGIVFGPPVWLIFLAMKNTYLLFYFFSTVLMTIAPLSWQMQGVVCFVLCMNRNMGPNVMFEDAGTKRLLQQKLVKNTKPYGRDI
jgi:hypothetical protein